jgi:eukaryotic-like serine/threonine-protein kinase
MPAPSDDSRAAGEPPQISIEPLRYHVGDVLTEKYRLDELLGQGGMGSVWRAHNLALDADVAVKFVHGELSSEETADRLQREAHATAQLEHPSAVRVYDFGRSELGDPFIVMELLRGESLADLIDRRVRFRPEEAVGLLLPVVSAVAAAHAKGIVHRDLKPENIVLVQQDGVTVPKVVDFGIAKIATRTEKRASSTGGQILGSPDYMSPEQAKGETERVGPRSDVWSLGIVLYELLAGKRPFHADQTLAQIRAIIEKDYESLESMGAADARLSEIVDRTLRKDIELRMPDMRSFGRALAEWAIRRGMDEDITGSSLAVWTRGSRTSITSTPPPPPAPRAQQSVAAVWTPAARPKSRGGLIGILIGALVLVAGAGAFLYLRGGEIDTTRTPAPAAPLPKTTPTPSAEPAAPTTAAPAVPASPTATEAPPVASAPEPPKVVDVTACVATLFPGEAFESNTKLDGICSEVDPRRGAKLLRSEIARRGLVRRETTSAMRAWAVLDWYELAAFAVARRSCCSGDLAALDLPPAVGTCPDLAPLLDKLAETAATHADTTEATSAFDKAARCVARGHDLNASVPSPYTYKGPPGGGAETAFRRIVDRARKR